MLRFCAMLMGIYSCIMSFSFLVLTGFLCLSDACTFIVGGDDGWTLKPSENYSHWAQRNRFQINDTLVFKYKKEHDSVFVVSKKDYSKCNKDNPIKTFKDGNSKFTFDKSGPFFFISGHEQNCEKGQKFDVIVLSDHHDHYHTAPSPPPLTPMHPPSSAPSPSPRAKSPTHAPTKPPTPSPTPQHAPPPPSNSPLPGVKSPTHAPTKPLSPAPSPSSYKAPTPSPTTHHSRTPSPTPSHAPPPAKTPSHAPSTANTPSHAPPVQQPSHSPFPYSPKNSPSPAPTHLSTPPPTHAPPVEPPPCQCSPPPTSVLHAPPPHENTPISHSPRQLHQMSLLHLFWSLVV